MPKPSIYEQINAVQVKGEHLLPSPRHWNPGLLRYKGRLWLSYRYHLGLEHASRSATAMVPIDKNTFQPTMRSQHLNLPATVGDEHFEDARLFMFRGEPHISYTQMTGYRPGVDYNCTIKYARLKLKGSTWHVEESWQPDYGRNSGYAKEKNWIFFEHDGQLWCIYQDHPTRKVIRLEGAKVVEEHETSAPSWAWGEVRGGTPPLPYGENQMIAVFHSSLHTEDPPHFRRYYGGAYLFDAKPPFAIQAISSKPLMAGSELDNHGFDPRWSAGWKPFIPFPGGLVQNGEDWIVSFGVNDWQSAVGTIKKDQIKWLKPDGSDRPMRYFSTTNGSLPIRMIGPNRAQQWVPWEVPAPNGRGIMAPKGYLKTDDGRTSETIEEMPKTAEITEEEYNRALAKKVKSLLLV
jgi:predicted GH43/DUF377 family glycosyl hydrolase